MMSCPRHPLAAAHAGHCAACLIEGAFFEPEAAEGGGRRELTILIPLGGSPGSTVFLVREQNARGRLMRLKTWDRPAPPGFLTEFERLRALLDPWRGGGVEVPEAAALDAWLSEAAGRCAATLRADGPDAQAQVWTVVWPVATWARRRRREAAQAV